jgi:cell wall-associated NlpC family hydrolase
VITIDEVVDCARSWLGVRFRHQGRSRYGVDCLGFVASVMKDLGSTTFLNALPKNYPRNPRASLEAALPNFSRRIDVEAGAMLLIQFPHASHPSHAAILTREGTIIHAYESVRKVVEMGYRAPWDKRTRSAWALPLVTYE